MFKKEPQIKALSNVKNSERKKLQLTIRDQQNVNYQFPSLTIKQTQFKSQSDIGTIFTDENNVPLWFKTKYNELMCPTVYTCWEKFDILPIVLTHEHVIEERILQGADLMLPGMIPPFDPRCTKGKLVGVSSTKSINIIKAIGIIQLDLPSYTEVVGKTGIGVKIIHSFGDGLCKIFKVKQIPPVSNIKEKNEEPVKSTANSKEIQVSSPLNNTDNVTNSKELTIQEVDDLFKQSLYYTLCHDNSLQLPISSSNFISNHIIANLPLLDTMHISLKKSSWNKATKFLKYWEEQGFIKLKGKGENISIISFNKEKDELKNFKSYKTLLKQRTNINKDNSKAEIPMIQAISLYKPINNAKEFINVTGLSFEKLFTLQELKSSLDTYISSKHLMDVTNKKMVILDDLLFYMINKSMKNDPKKIVSRPELIEKFFKNNFTEYFQLLKDDVPLYKSPLKGNIPNVQIIIEMKIGRKIVTKVFNFDKFNIDAQELAFKLRKQCNGSTTVNETLNSPKTTEVQVQGAHGSVVINVLNNYGVPTKWINLENKLKAKKSKNHLHI